MNHRVKNSLALVTSLLALQARQAPDPELRRLLLEVSGRISVVARVHQRLYESGRHDRLEIGPFLAEIAKGTVRAYDPDGRIALDMTLRTT